MEFPPVLRPAEQPPLTPDATLALGAVAMLDVADRAPMPGAITDAEIAAFMAELEGGDLSEADRAQGIFLGTSAESALDAADQAPMTGPITDQEIAAFMTNLDEGILSEADAAQGIFLGSSAESAEAEQRQLAQLAAVESMRQLDQQHRDYQELKKKEKEGRRKKKSTASNPHNPAPVFSILTGQPISLNQAGRTTRVPSRPSVAGRISRSRLTPAA